MNNRSVLVVDDYKVVRDCLRIILELIGFDVVCCDGGASALDRIKEKRFDVILVAYNMWKMNGDDVCRLFRPLCPDALIVGMSLEDCSRAFLRAEADIFVRKSDVARVLVSLKEKNSLTTV